MITSLEARKLTESKAVDKNAPEIKKALLIIETKIRAKATLGASELHFPFDNINTFGDEAASTCFLNCLSTQQVNTLIEILKDLGYTYTCESLSMADALSGTKKLHTLAW